MFEGSLLNKTGQLWKFWLAIVMLVVGSIAPLFPVTQIDWTGGTIIAIVGYVFGIVAIRCNECGNMWFWGAAIGTSPYGPIFKSTECPACKHSFAEK